MLAPRALALTIAVALAGCTSSATLVPSPSGSAAESTTTGVPSATSNLVPLPLTSAGMDPDVALEIAPPYELEPPTGSDFDNLSGQIQGLPFDLANSAGTGYAPSDFPLGFRFIHEAGNEVGVVAFLEMPAEVAALVGLLESIATAAAAEANARLSYETINGVKVGIVQGPIASTLAIVDGHLVFVQTGLPAVDPKDLMTAVIAASDE